MKNLSILLSVFLFFAGCTTIDVYEKTQPFPEHAWSSNEKLTFTFDIADTVAQYNIYAVIRHTDAYHFNNMWLSLTTIPPNDAVKTQQVKLQLGNDIKGWMGSAMDDIIEHRVLLNKFPLQMKRGSYTFIMQQIMREDPLQNVMNAGLRVEKARQ